MERLHALRGPPVTTGLVSLTIVVLILTACGIVNSFQMMLVPSFVLDHKQYWRLVSSFLFHGDFNMRSFFQIQTMYAISSMIEEQSFGNRPLDYLFVLLFINGSLVVLRMMQVFDTPFMAYPSITALLYLFCRLAPDNRAVMMWAVEVPMWVVPLSMLVLMGYKSDGAVTLGITSMLVGHIAWYFIVVFPRITGIHIFRVQDRVQRLFDLVW